MATNNRLQNITSKVTNAINSVKDKLTTSNTSSTKTSNTALTTKSTTGTKASTAAENYSKTGILPTGTTTYLTRQANNIVDKTNSGKISQAQSNFWVSENVDKNSTLNNLEKNSILKQSGLGTGNEYTGKVQSTNINIPTSTDGIDLATKTQVWNEAVKAANAKIASGEGLTNDEADFLTTNAKSYYRAIGDKNYNRMAGTVAGLGNNSVTGSIASLVSGKKYSDLFNGNAQDMFANEISDENKKAYKTGETVGAMADFALQSAFVEPALTAKLGRTAIGANLATKNAKAFNFAADRLGDLTVGLAQNLAIERGEGLKGADYWKQVGLDTAADLALGSAISGVGDVIGRQIKKTNYLRKGYSKEASDALVKLENSTTFKNDNLVSKLKKMYNDVPEIKTAKAEAAKYEGQKTIDIKSKERTAMRRNWKKAGMEYGSAVTDANGKVSYTGEVAKDKRADIIIGLPSSGKSSALVDPISAKYKSRLIDSDEFKKMIPEYNNGFNADGVHEESQMIAGKVFKDSINKGDNIVLPIVGSNSESVFEKYVELLKGKGYEVHISYNHLPEGIAAARNLERFLATNRLVDLDATSFKYKNLVDKTYEDVKDWYRKGIIDGYSKYSNNVEFGEKPILIESKTILSDDGRIARERGGSLLQSSKGRTGDGRNGNTIGNPREENLSTNGGREGNLLRTEKELQRGQVDGGLSKLGTSNETRGKGLGSDRGLSNDVNKKLNVSEYDDYSKSLDKAKKEDTIFGGYVDSQSVNDLKDKNAKVFLTANKKAGVGISSSGNIFGVFNSKTNENRGLSKYLLRTAFDNGGTHLDCYGRNLVNKYSVYGDMVPVARVKFSSKHVNDPTLLKKRPDIYFMVRNNKTIDETFDAVDKRLTKKYSNEELKSLPLLSYEEAETLTQKLADETFNAKGLPTASNGKTLKPNGADTNNARTKLETSKSRRNYETGEGYKYEATTHEQRTKIASEDIKQNGAAYEYDQIKSKDAWTDIDTVKAQQLIDGDELTNVQRKNLAEKIREKASQAGQTLEAQKHFYDGSLAGKLTEASSVVNKATKEIEAKQPKVLKDAKTEANKYVNFINSAAEKSKTKAEFIQKVKAKVEAEPKTNIKAEQYTRDKVMNIVNSIKKFDNANLEETIDEVNNIVLASKNIPTLSSKNISDIKKFMDAAEQYEKAGNARMAQISRAKADQVIADIASSSLKQKFKSVQRIFLLSSPKTLLTRNAGGNIGLGLVENVKDIPATAVDAITSLFTGERYKTLPVGFTLDNGSLKVDASKLTSQFSGLKKGFLDEITDVKYGVDTGASGRYFENAANTRIWNVDKAKNKFQKVSYKTMDVMDKTINYALKFGDRPFYEAAYSSRYNELTNLVKRGKLNISEADIVNSAKLYALDRTFQSDTKLYRFGAAFRDAINKVTGGVGGDLIIPFTMTPANIMDKLLDYSPVGLARAGFELGKIGKGTFDQTKFADTLGRAFTGMGLIMLGYVLRKKGLLTGNAYDEAENYDAYQAEKAKGIQSYSLQVGDDTTVTIDWADPVGSMLIIGGDFADANGTDDEMKGLMQAAFDGTSRAVDGVFDRGFLSGFLDLTENIKDEGILKGVADTLIGQIGSQAVPNIVKSLNRVIDTEKRETYDSNILKKQLNIIKSGTPFASKTLPTKKDITGETVEQYQGRNGLARFYESILAPYNKSVTQNDTVNDECIRLFKETENQDALLQSADKSFSFSGTEYTVDTAEQLSKMQENIGKYAEKNILELMKTSDYKNATDAEKADMVADINKAAVQYGRKQYLVSTGKMTATDFDFNSLDKTVREKYSSTTLSKEKFTTAYNNQKELDTTTAKAMSLVKDGASYENASVINKSITESGYKKAQKLVSLGVTPEKYDELRDKADLNDNGSVTKKEAYTVLKDDTSLTKEQKMYLQAYLSNTKL